MRYSILFSILILFLASCNKNKFNTVPSLKFISVNNSELRSGQIIIFTLSFTDAEGDLSDSLYVEKKVLNCTSSSNSGFKSFYPLPDFPTTKNQEGDIKVSFGYRVNSYPTIRDPGCLKNDTAIFKFVLKDKAQHKSDTAFSDKVVIIY